MMIIEGGKGGVRMLMIYEGQGEERDGKMWRWEEK